MIDDRPPCTLRPGALSTCYCTGRPGCQSPRPDDDDHCLHCGDSDCDGDSCQDDLQETYPGVTLRDPEQLRADIGRWAREIRTWRAAGLTEEHPNIKRRLSRIALAQHLLDQLEGS